MIFVRRGRTLLLVLVLSLATYTLLVTHGLAPPPPEFSRFSLLTVKSGSMSPVMATHSLIVVDKKKVFPLYTGDVITFHAADGRLITHRIVAIGFDGDPYYITKGDANRSTDLAPVRQNDLYGRVVFITPASFIVITRFLRSSAAFYTLCGLFLILLVQLASAKIQN